MSAPPRNPPPFARLVAGACILATACGGGLALEDLDRLQIVEGNGRIATVGAVVDVLPKVRALTADGRPIPGLAVRFDVQSGGGSVTGGSATTNELGDATVGSWTLGPTVGQNLLVASSGSLSATFEAVSLVGPAAAVEKLAGDGETGISGRIVLTTPSVRITDAFGNAVRNQEVTFAIGGTEGTVDPPTSTTDSVGVATAGTWTLGPTPGPNTLIATAGTGTATFTVTGVPGAVSIALAAGDSQMGTVGQQLGQPVDVLVTDAQGLPVSVEPVAFVVFAGGGAVTADTVLTNGSGIASNTWTLGTGSGQNLVSATVDMVGTVQFTATATPDVAVGLTVLSGADQIGAVNANVPFPPAVVVGDQYANPVPGIDVTFSVTGGGGSITDPIVTSDSAGIAAATAWTLGPAQGAHSAQASFPGATPVAFDATALTSVYDIDLVRSGGGGPAVTQAIDLAVAKWETFLIGDLADVSFAANPLAANACGGTHPEVNDVVDDVRIFMRIESIDGPGNILGAAGPCAIRDSADGGLTVIGSMRFDIDDLVNLANQGILADVMVHEIGHVMGIGTLWDDFGLLQNPSLPANEGADTHFNGPLAIAAFDSLGGSGFSQSKVPVENTQGGAGTRDAHWRESVLDNENMTGFVDQGTNPFSAISTQSLADLGYVVNLAASEPFTFTATAPAHDGNVSVTKIELIDDVRRGPVYVVRRNGKITGVYRP